MNKLNKFFAFAVVLSAVISMGSTAVYAQADKDEINLYQTMYGMEKRALIESSMNLDESQKEAFWKVYEEYEVERRELGLKRVEIIKDYVENMETTDDMKLDDIAKRALASESNYTKLESKYYEKMKKVSNSAVAFRWMQIERYLMNSIRMAISEELPFLPERKN